MYESGAEALPAYPTDMMENTGPYDPSGAYEEHSDLFESAPDAGQYFRDDMFQSHPPAVAYPDDMFKAAP